MNTKNNFLSYIKKSIEFKALDFKKQYNKLKKSEYCTSNISISLENKNSYIDYIPCESYETDDNDIYDFFDSFFNRNQISQIKNLTNLQKKIIYKKYIQNINERNIALELNTSYQNINNIKKRALKKLNRS